MTEKLSEGERRFDMHSGQMAGDLLSGLIDELRLLPKPWPAMPSVEQTEIIDRLRQRVTENVRQFCTAMNTGGRVAIAAQLEAMSLKESCKVTLKVDGSGGKHDLLDAIGASVVIVLSNVELYLSGLGEVKADDDQRVLDLEKAAGDVIEQASKPKKKPPREGPTREPGEEG